MGLFSRMIGFEQYQAQQNAVLGQHLMNSSSTAAKQRIAQHIAERFSEGFYRGRKPMGEVLKAISERPRGVQMQFVANTALDFGLATGLHNYHFAMMRNPLVTADWCDDATLRDLAASFSRKNGVTIKWPGNDRPLDFTALHAGRVTMEDTEKLMESIGA